MNQKGFINIVLIVLVVVFAGAVGYFALTKKQESTTQRPTTPPSAVTQTTTPQPPIDETTSWKTFIHDNAFSFKYPRGVEIVSGCLLEEMGIRNPKNPRPAEQCLSFNITKPKVGAMTIFVMSNSKKLSLQNFVDQELKLRGYPGYPFVVRGNATDLKMNEVTYTVTSDKETVVYSFEETKTLLEPMRGWVGYIRISDDKVLYFDYLKDKDSYLYETILRTLMPIK